MQQKLRQKVLDKDKEEVGEEFKLNTIYHGHLRGQQKPMDPYTAQVWQKCQVYSTSVALEREWSAFLPSGSLVGQTAQKTKD